MWSHSRKWFVMCSSLRCHIQCHVTPHSVSRDATFSVTWRHIQCHVMPYSVSRDAIFSVMLRHIQCHVTPHSVSRDATFSVTWRHIQCHVMPYSVSRYATFSVTWRHIQCHVTPYSVSRDAIFSVTLRHIQCHVTPHSVSRDTIFSVTWRHIQCHITPHSVSRDCDRRRPISTWEMCGGWETMRQWHNTFGLCCRRGTSPEDAQKCNVIPESHSEWGSPSVFVKNKCGGLPWCVDFHEVNRLTRKSHTHLHSLRNVSRHWKNHSSYQNFTLWGYWQIPPDEQSIPKTTFLMMCGLYEFTRMPFGLTMCACEPIVCLSRALFLKAFCVGEYFLSSKKISYWREKLGEILEFGEKIGVISPIFSHISSFSSYLFQDFGEKVT